MAKVVDVGEDIVDVGEDIGDRLEAKAEMLGERLPKLKSPPSTTTRNCVLMIVGLYVSTQIVTMIAKEYQGGNSKLNAAVQAVNAASPLVAIMPMMCVLFLIARLRALHLTNGHPDQYGLPHMEVRYAMYASTYACGFSWVFLAVASQYLTEKKWLKLVQYSALLVVYGGCVVVCLGIHWMRAPKEEWQGKEPPFDMADLSVMTLAMVFFLVHFLLECSDVLANLGGDTSNLTSEIFKYGTHGLKSAPTLCTILIAERMRAVQLDPETRSFQSDREHVLAHLVMVFATLLQATMAVCLPLYVGATIKTGHYDYDTTLEYKTWFILNKGLHFMRLKLKLSVIAAAGYSIILTAMEKRPEGETPGFPLSVMCVLALGALYLVVHLLNVIAAAVRSVLQLKGRDAVSEALQVALKIAEGCPLYSALIFAARLRARTLQGLGNCKDPESAREVLPQRYCLWAFIALTTCVFLQTFVVILRVAMPKGRPALTTGSRNSDGASSGAAVTRSEQPQAPQPTFRNLVESLESFSQKLCYLSAVAIICAILQMSYDNATMPDGSLLRDHCSEIKFVPH